MIGYSEGQKIMEHGFRGLPHKRAHRKVIVTAIMNRKLSLKIVE